MALNKAHAAYQANSIANSKPEELTLMLYNGLVRFLNQAKKTMENNNIQKSHENLVRAQDIILEFQITLDMKVEISHNLMLLYDYMHRRLVEANLKKDVTAVVEVLSLATQLRDTWEQLVRKVKEEGLNQDPNKNNSNGNIQSIAK